MSSLKVTDPTLLQGATRFGEVKVRDRGRLPHWERETGTYFVTFRLADSLPQRVLEKIIERQRVLEAAKQSGLKLHAAQELLVSEYSPRRIEQCLDNGNGACYLRDPRVAELVADSFGFWDGNKYRLAAWCLMPNHVHVVFRLLPGHELSALLHSWKSYTARMANRVLGRTGAFWQREYYDRLIRDKSEFERAVEYVIRNPERAGLTGWTWVWCAGEDAPTTAGLETSATY